MKKKWFWTLFGWNVLNVPNFVIKEVSKSHYIKHYNVIRHDGLKISLICFKDLEDQMVYESAIFIGDRVDDDSIINHESLGDMFEYAIKLGNGEISAFYRPDKE